ncbi:MAG: outer membrane beta-barrel protein [Burkholderiales bacterium]
MKKAAVVALMAVGSAVIAAPAEAQLNMSAFYVGAGIGQSKAKDFCGGGGADTCDDKDTAWKLFGGYQFTRNFSAEIGYSNFGKFKATLGPFTDEAKVTAWELSALGAWPIVQQLSVFGRLGIYRATVKETTNFAGDFEHDNNDWTFGLGLEYDFTRNLAIRGEWQRYRKVGGGDVAFGANVGDKSDLDVLGVSALWRF